MYFALQHARQAAVPAWDLCRYKHVPKNPNWRIHAQQDPHNQFGGVNQHGHERNSLNTADFRLVIIAQQSQKQLCGCVRGSQACNGHYKAMAAPWKLQKHAAPMAAPNMRYHLPNFDEVPGDQILYNGVKPSRKKHWRMMTATDCTSSNLESSSFSPITCKTYREDENDCTTHG